MPSRRLAPLLVAACLGGLFAGIAPPLLSAAAVAGVTVVIVAIANPVLGLAALAIAVPLESSRTRRSSPGYSDRRVGRRRTRDSTRLASCPVDAWL